MQGRQKMCRDRGSSPGLRNGTYSQYGFIVGELAGQPGVARAFALRAELCSSFLASRSLNPEMNCSSMRKIAFV